MGIKTWSVISSIPYLLEGVGMTLQVTILALVFGAVIGIVIALARIYGGMIPRKLAISYSRIVRSLPLLVILFALYFGGFVDIPAYWAVVIALAVHTSAYQAEIFRGAIQSVSAGQMEAAVALGMSKTQGIFSVILPQALRLAIPYWSNEAAIVLKDSALAYVLGIAELMRRGEYLSARTSQPLLTYTIVGFIYFVLTYIFTKTMGYLQSRVRIPS